jgi:hypothetical protein
MKAGLILPGTASFRVIRVFRGALRLHHYGLEVAAFPKPMQISDQPFPREPLIR